MNCFPSQSNELCIENNELRMKNVKSAVLPPTISIAGRRHKRLPSLSRGTWLVARVKTNQEKQLAFEAASRGLSFFLPMQACVVRRARQFHEAAKCIIPGYFFLMQREMDDRHKLIETRRVLSYIPVPDSMQPQFHEELESLKRACETMNFREFEFKTGERVTVESMPGVEGIVEGYDRSGLVVVKVSMLGCAVFRARRESLLRCGVGGNGEMRGGVQCH